MTLKEMVEMELNEGKQVQSGPGFFVLRVPGGWIYTKDNIGSGASVFVQIPAKCAFFQGVDF